MENITNYSEIIERGIKVLGIDAEQTRCSEPGQWLLFNGQTEIYIDLWEEKSNQGWIYFKNEDPLFIFQVLSPVSYFPEEDKLKEMYEELLENNLNMLFASFTVNTKEKMVAVKFRRIADELTVQDVVEAIESTGFYAETARTVLQERFGSRGIEVESESE
jgi:hypothetical protein